MTLSERITELEAALLEARATIAEHEGRHEIASSIYRKLERKLAADLGWLRELRARRITMGRVADDERSAPADLCTCNISPELRRSAVGRRLAWEIRYIGCALHPRPRNCDGEPARVRGPRLRCGAFRLDDCSPAIQDGCDEICEAAEERFGFEPTAT